MLIQKDFNYTPKNRNRMLHIYLPDDYDSSDRRYTVFYFFDGHNLFLDSHATYGKSWGLSEYLSSTFTDVIVCGLECGHEGDERLYEYCPYSLQSAFGGPLAGIGELTMQWIVNEVKPFMDRSFRTLPDREHTAICGSSMGGLMSLYAVLRYNEVFSMAGCLSSSIGICMEMLEREIRKSSLDSATRIYLSYGTEEMKHFSRRRHLDSMNLRLKRLLEEKGAEGVMVYEQENGEHCERDWEKQNPIYFPFLLSGRKLS
ncbi:MAG: alpha/beta hydrolase [Spirochaetales bacterium]|nr:alpha/beta hydrolase [Spirochaetales bacterium]